MGLSVANDQPAHLPCIPCLRMTDHYEINMLQQSSQNLLEEAPTLREIHFETLKYMLLPSKKNILVCQKFRTKIWRVHLDVLCVHDKFREKLIFFAPYKKEKIMSPERGRCFGFRAHMLLQY